MESKKSFIETLTNLILAWTKEYENSDLQDIDPDLFSSISFFLAELEKKALEEENSISREIFSMYKKIVEWILADLALIRKLKIASRIIAYGQPPKKLLPEEIAFADALKIVLEASERKERVVEDPLKSVRVKCSKDETIERLIVISQSKLRSFVGADTLVYRGLRKGTIMNIPKKNYELLVSKKAYVKSIYQG